MKLIGSTTSPFVRKVRIVLAEKKLDYQFVLEDVWARDDILQVNPLGKVPALVMEGGHDSITGSMFDSRVIVEYLDTLSPVGKLIPEKGRERAEVRTWEALADGVLDAAVLVRLEQTWTGRPPEQRSEAWCERQLSKVHAGLQAMDAALGDKPWCANSHFTLADIAVGCCLDWLRFRFPHLDWATDHPNLARHAEKLAQRPSFSATAPVVTA
ncbi:glutathione S-transferase N-terminal domain-containing protein [Inhella gelatinilytica]|uniref:Glutathione S-transferase N-terminal domain-containing protein n=1 Tax=Inhella gelatinilytica TaxID=2795030 RepID=A0A931N9N5_9BURK|nr:glutathione S-transferase N-terminal domain-containing protein [Inhella gelatinilytica]MBH9551553.1 glutathione S-transferase N-terminal domain-containing protein [Inhella gelatinilytica]